MASALADATQYLEERQDSLEDVSCWVCAGVSGHACGDAE